VVKVTYLQRRDYSHPKAPNRTSTTEGIEIQPSVRASTEKPNASVSIPSHSPRTPDDAPDTTNLVVFGINQTDSRLVERIRDRIATMRGVGMSSPWVYFTSLSMIVNLQSMVAYLNVQRTKDQTEVLFHTHQGTTKLKNTDVRWY
jgi:hypothetical protein